MKINSTLSKIKGKISNSALDLLKKMLDPNAASRYNALSAINHPWIKSSQNRISAPIEPRVFKGLSNSLENNALRKACLMFIAAKIPSSETQ